MEFTINQTKDIFDLIVSVNKYSLPLLLSLLIPFLWIIYRKLLGLEFIVDENISEIEKSFFSKIRIKFLKFIKVYYISSNRIIFYFCLTLFIAGLIILKVGEYKEEIIRQNAISLKHLYDESGYLFFHKDGLKRAGYDEMLIEDITYNYPEIFVKSGENIVCVDPLIKNNNYRINHVLLGLYLDNKLKDSSAIRIGELFQKDFFHDSIRNVDYEIRNVKNFFSKDIVYTYLASSLNGGKYYLSVKDNQDYIVKAK